jgi:hypothetical protein
MDSMVLSLSKKIQAHVADCRVKGWNPSQFVYVGVEHYHALKSEILVGAGERHCAGCQCAKDFTVRGVRVVPDMHLSDDEVRFHYYGLRGGV